MSSPTRSSGFEYSTLATTTSWDCLMDSDSVETARPRTGMSFRKGRPAVLRTDSDFLRPPITNSSASVPIWKVVPVWDLLMRAEPSAFQPSREMLSRSKVILAALEVTTGVTRRSNLKPSVTIGYWSQPWMMPGAAFTLSQLVL